jgi:hypothetical protein
MGTSSARTNTSPVRPAPPPHLEEHPVALLHDVGLVHRRHALPVVEEGELKGVLGDAQGLLLGDDL